MCLLEKLTQEPINSGIKLCVATPYTNVFSKPKTSAVSEKFYNLLSA